MVLLIQERVGNTEFWYKEKPCNEGTAPEGLWGARAGEGRGPHS